MRLAFNHRFTSRMACAILLGLALPVWAQSNSPSDVFESLYGEEAKAASSTRELTDDVELAKKLLAAAEASQQQLPVMLYFAEKAYDFGSKHPDGYNAAIAAMQLVRQKVKLREKMARDRVLNLQQKRYDRADPDDKVTYGNDLIGTYLDIAEDHLKANEMTDAALHYVRARKVAQEIDSNLLAEIDTGLSEIRARQQINRRIEMYERRLKENPKDVTAHQELFRLYMVELDAPHRARRHTDLGADEVGRKLMPSILKGWRRAKPPVLIEIGDYYRELARTASDTSARRMLVRAKSYYERFLDRHKSEDLLRIKATLALREVNEAIAKIDQADMKVAGETGQWVDLVKLADTSKHTVRGKWVVRSDSTLSKANVGQVKGQAYFALPAAPAGGYELEVKFIRPAGNGGIAVILPVSDQRVMLIVGGKRGRFGGLHMLDGRDYTNNAATVRGSRIRNGKLTTISVKVGIDGDNATIDITQDGKKFLSWKGPRSRLSTAPVYPDNVLGLATSNNELTFKSVRVRGTDAPIRQVDIEYESPDTGDGGKSPMRKR